MVKLSWWPAAAKMLLGLATADQRRLVESVGEFRRRFDHEAEAFASGEQHCISASGYDLCLRVSRAGVEVEEVRLSEEQP